MRGFSWRRERAKREEESEATGEWGRLGCSAGVPTGLAPRMQTCRIRRVRQAGFESAGRDFFLRWADVAPSSPLAPGSRDNTCQHAGPRLEFSYSYPPDTICPNRIGRLRRCPNSDISYKLMLHLKMLKKSAIFKKNRHYHHLSEPPMRYTTFLV
jgi:hypothetical protein